MEKPWVADAGLVFWETKSPRTATQSKKQDGMCERETSLSLRACFSWERGLGCLTAISSAVWNYCEAGDYSASLDG